MIDIRANQNEADFLKRTLKHHGFEADFGKAIAAMGRKVRDHNHLRNLLTTCGPDMRNDLYEALRPNLQFTAMPLDWYISQAKQMAEREQLPTLDEKGNLQPFKPAQDASSLQKQVEGLLAAAVAERTLILHCSVCTAVEKFTGSEAETKVSVAYKARRAGWVHDPVRETETCPECMKKRAN